MYQFSAASVARSEENKAKQIVATLGRAALSYISKGASATAEAGDKLKDKLQEDKVI